MMSLMTKRVERIRHFEKLRANLFLLDMSVRVMIESKVWKLGEHANTN